MDIRQLMAEDCQLIASAFAHQGWHKPVEQYNKYFVEQQAGLRTVLVAHVDSNFVGYLTIMWQSAYQPFAEQRIPEIVDFNVLIAYQRQGIGSALMDAAEQRIVEHSAIAGIAVGLTHDYGPAHILYTKRGYVPDVRGITQNNQFLTHGSVARVDDSLVLHLLKHLKSVDC